jgi:hypothetical protein
VIASLRTIRHTNCLGRCAGIVDGMVAASFIIWQSKIILAQSCEAGGSTVAPIRNRGGALPDQAPLSSVLSTDGKFKRILA